MVLSEELLESFLYSLKVDLGVCLIVLTGCEVVAEEDTGVVESFHLVVCAKYLK